MAEFVEGQRVRISARYATINGELHPNLQQWVGLQGTVLIPRPWRGGYDVIDLDTPPEASEFGYRFLDGELEPVTDTVAESTEGQGGAHD